MFGLTSLTNNQTKAVSPVIGVILMVAITVILSTVAGVFVFDIGSGLSTEATAGIDIQDTGEEITIQYTNTGTVEKLYVTQNGESLPNSTLTSVGDSYTVPNGTEGDEITVVGVTSDGTETVINSISVTQDFTAPTISDGDSNTDTTSDSTQLAGVVQINPKIEGATVEAIRDGSVIASTITNSTGAYNLSVENTTGVSLRVTVTGFESSQLSAPLYASATQQAQSTTNFSFTNERSSTVNGQTVLVSYGIEETTTKNQIATVEQLQAINKNTTTLNQDYELIKDIDASGTASWNGGAGFKPVGIYPEQFTGSLDGNNHTISGITVNRPSLKWTGVFGWANSNTYIMKDISFTSVDITGDNRVGIIGQASGGSIQNVYADGSIHAVDRYGGGIAGFMDEGVIKNTHSDVDVTGDYKFIGGVVGESREGAITNVKSTGSVDAPYFVGGIAGAITYANITDSYSTAAVNASSYAGGIAGELDDNAGMTRVYAAGSLSTDGNTGALAGKSNGEISDSYWDTETTNHSDAIGTGYTYPSDSHGLTTSDMTGSNATSTMPAFDFTTTWNTTTGYPTNTDD